jgi:hypothetical protein
MLAEASSTITRTRRIKKDTYAVAVVVVLAFKRMHFFYAEQAPPQTRGLTAHQNKIYQHTKETHGAVCVSTLKAHIMRLRATCAAAAIATVAHETAAQLAPSVSVCMSCCHSANSFALLLYS